MIQLYMKLNRCNPFLYHWKRKSKTKTLHKDDKLIFRFSCKLGVQPYVKKEKKKKKGVQPYSRLTRVLHFSFKQCVVHLHINTTQIL